MTYPKTTIKLILILFLGISTVFGPHCEEGHQTLTLQTSTQTPQTPTQTPQQPQQPQTPQTPTQTPQQPQQPQTPQTPTQTPQQPPEPEPQLITKEDIGSLKFRNFEELSSCAFSGCSLHEKGTYSSDDNTKSAQVSIYRYSQDKSNLNIEEITNYIDNNHQEFLFADEEIVDNNVIYNFYYNDKIVKFWTSEEHIIVTSYNDNEIPTDFLNNHIERYSPSSSSSEINLDVTHNSVSNKLIFRQNFRIIPKKLYNYRENRNLNAHYTISLEGEFQGTGEYSGEYKREDIIENRGSEQTLELPLSLDSNQIEYINALLGPSSVNYEVSIRNFVRMENNIPVFERDPFFESIGTFEITPSGGGCPNCVIEPTLFMGSKNEQYKRYDLLFIFEDRTKSQTEAKLTELFITSPFSLFGTNPFLGKENKFNIWYVTIPRQTYTGTYCNPPMGPGYQDNIEVFRAVSNRYIRDGVVYWSKNPAVWPVVYMGETESGQILASHMELSDECNHEYDSVKLFAHEFGHLFGILNDEYTSDINSQPFPNLNCANENKKPTSSWTKSRWSNIPNYNQEVWNGCTKSDYQRPTPNSIMKTQQNFNQAQWKDAWGPVNEYYLSERLKQYV